MKEADWKSFKKAALEYAKAKRKTPEQTKAFIEWLWREFEHSKNHDLPKRRWNYQKQKEMHWQSHAEHSLPEEG